MAAILWWCFLFRYVYLRVCCTDTCKTIRNVHFIDRYVLFVWIQQFVFFYEQRKLNYLIQLLLLSWSMVLKYGDSFRSPIMSAFILNSLSVSLGVRHQTCNVFVYGEFSCLPFLYHKKRILKFWSKTVNNKDSLI